MLMPPKARLHTLECERTGTQPHAHDETPIQRDCHTACAALVSSGRSVRDFFCNSAGFCHSALPMAGLLQARSRTTFVSWRLLRLAQPACPLDDCLPAICQAMESPTT